MSNAMSEAQSISRVPGAAHYQPGYLGGELERLCSYRQQLRYTLSAQPRNVLVVGKGDGLVTDILLRSGVAVSTLDVAEELNPDIVASVESIPLPSGSVDVAVCCQVLEHLPFEALGACVQELCRVSRSRVVISLPDVRRFVSLRCNIGRWQIATQWSPPRRARVFPHRRLEIHGHHWEIGFRGTEFKTVRARMHCAGWRCHESRRVYDLWWHTFFILSPAEHE